MEIKKSEKVNLEKYRTIFIEIGLIVALLIAFLAFEFSTTAQKAEGFGELLKQEDEVDLIEITRQNEVPLPPPPPMQKTVSQILDIIDDKVKVEDDLDIDADDDENTRQDVMEMSTVVLDDEPDFVEPQIFVNVEKMPQFPGGERALIKYIAEHIKYPEMAKENDIQGTVYVKFVVDEKGNVTNVGIIRGVDEHLDQEAIRVVKSLPKWTPGEQNQKPVKVSHSLPIRFALQH